MSLAPERRGWITLGQMLVQDGILTDEQVSAALERQSQWNFARRYSDSRRL